MYAHEVRLSAESSVLAALIQAPEGITSVDLCEEDFPTVTGAKVYASLLRLIEKRQPVSILSISGDMQKNGELAAIGGMGELKRIGSATAVAKNLKRYVAILRESAQELRLEKAAEAMNAVAKNQGVPIADRVAQSIEILQEIEKHKPSREPVHISDGVRQSLNQYLEYDGMPDGWIPGIHTGIFQLDEHTGGFRKGNLIIVAGRPSMGKTALAMLFAEKAAVKGKKVYVSSMEMPAGELTQRMSAGVGHISLHEITRGKLEPESMARMAAAMTTISDLPIWIDDQGGQTADAICASARRHHARKGLDMLVIDQLSLIDYSRHDSLVRGIGEATGKFKSLAKELGIPVICVAQVNRESAKDKTVRRPVLTDLQDSGRIEQDADVVLFVHRKSYYDPENENPTEAEIIIAKQRQGQRGVVIQVGWRGEYTRFVEHPEAWSQPTRNDVNKGRFAKEWD